MDDTDLIRRAAAIEAVMSAGPSYYMTQTDTGFQETHTKLGAFAFRTDIGDAIRALPAATPAPVVPVGARVTGWQPIETAPRDGVTEVLMYDPVLGMAVWPSANSPWPNVTHWMPLPGPPAALLPAGEGE